MTIDPIILTVQRFFLGATFPIVIPLILVPDLRDLVCPR